MPADHGRARTLVARAVYELGTVVGTYPSVVLPIARSRRHGEPVGVGTEVVIEGFPRSANTLAVASLVASQPRPVRVAHHVHAPAQIVEGARRRLPTLVLVREPEHAVVELVLLKPALTVAQGLRGWVRFYEPLLRYRDRFVVATTEEVLSDFDAVIRRLDARFGTTFGDEDMMGSRDQIEREMAAYQVGREGPGLPFVGRTDETEEGRDADRERLRRAYRSPRLTDLRARAGSIHAAFLAMVR